MVHFPQYAISKRIEGKHEGIKFLKLVSVMRAPDINAVIAKFLHAPRSKGDYVVVRLVKSGSVGKIKRSFKI